MAQDVLVAVLIVTSHDEVTVTICVDAANSERQVDIERVPDLEASSEVVGKGEC